MTRDFYKCSWVFQLCFVVWRIVILYYNLANDRLGLRKEYPVRNWNFFLQGLIKILSAFTTIYGDKV